MSLNDELQNMSFHNLIGLLGDSPEARESSFFNSFWIVRTSQYDKTVAGI
jgi:hypothetical protein